MISSPLYHKTYCIQVSLTAHIWQGKVRECHEGRQIEADEKFVALLREVGNPHAGSVFIRDTLYMVWKQWRPPLRGEICFIYHLKVYVSRDLPLLRSKAVLSLETQQSLVYSQKLRLTLPMWLCCMPRLLKMLCIWNAWNTKIILGLLFI